MDDNPDSRDAAKPPRHRLKQVRILMWALVGLAILGVAAILLLRRDPANPPPPQTTGLQANFGGPFTLTGADGKSFSSSRLAGKPYAIFFGFTRCGDVCPITLGRLVKLRKEAGGADALNIVFVTIDPKNDGPREVGQYADLFGSPIIGLTGSPEQIARVKKQYGIYAEPNPAAEGHGDMINHTSTVLLFGADGTFRSTISGQEPDSSALDKIKQLT